MNTELQLNPRIIQVLQKQITELVKRPPDSVKFVLNETDILDIQADIIGPIETPYYGGVFRCKLVLSNEFPQVAPKGYFITKIFHPNVSEKGEICVNTLKKDWNPLQWSLSGIFEVIRCLLIVPFPESSLNDDAGRLFMEDYEEYASHAKMITQLYAKPKGDSLILNSGSTKMDEEFTPSDKSGSLASFSPLKSLGSKNDSITDESQLTKENLDNGLTEIKLEKCQSLGFASSNEDVLASLTNSLQSNSGLSAITLKKQGSENLGSGLVSSLGNANQSNGLTFGTVGNGQLASKKDDGKKIWKKRI